jgi:predicted nuclease of predicted toxin-antitoxin system
LLSFKLDENVPIEAAEQIRSFGHDCHTVYDESLAGTSDPTIALACARERRTLITLDLDFADVRTYPPGSHSGIIVLRPRSPDRDSCFRLIARLLPIVTSEPVGGNLWIVDDDRVRMRAPEQFG